MPLEGTLVAQFQWFDAGANDLVLDFKDPAARIRGVRVNGAPVEWEARHDHVVVPAGALTSGDRNRVNVEFQAGDEALNRNEDFLYTLFVPDRAHFSLPLFDQPNLKARFSLTLEVPDGWVTVANGGVTEETAVNASGGAERGTTYRFAETEPIPTYLFAFAVGDFQIAVAARAGRTMRMFHRETDADKVARNREAIFDLHAVALEWLEDYTQIAYPFGKFDFVLIPPFQYGGMEHPGSIFYRQSSLLLDASATQAQYLGRASLIAHETTHMWFGDLVTMSWFDDVWTKEVFANFMAAKIVHPSFPEVNHDLRFFLAHHDTAYRVDRTAGANPIRQPLENLKEAGSLYGPIIYQKAPIVMRQLERLVGEDLFRDGLREYLQTFRYGNASWPDLIDILDRRADAGLAAWSEAWVDEPGRPVVTTQMLDDTHPADRLQVSQNDPDDRGRLWPQQLELLLSYDEGDVRMPLSLSGAGASLGWAGRARPNFVLPNASGIEYGHFRLDPESVDYLMSNLPTSRTRSREASRGSPCGTACWRKRLRRPPGSSSCCEASRLRRSSRTPSRFSGISARHSGLSWTTTGVGRTPRTSSRHSGRRSPMPPHPRSGRRTFGRGGGWSCPTPASSGCGGSGRNRRTYRGCLCRSPTSWRSPRGWPFAGSPGPRTSWNTRPSGSRTPTARPASPSCDPPYPWIRGYARCSLTDCATLPTGNGSPGCSRRWATCTTRCGPRTPAGSSARVWSWYRRSSARVTSSSPRAG